MTQQSTPLPAPQPTPALIDFTPVPRQRARRGHWSAERQRAFIEALAETGSVVSACRQLGASKSGVYALRAHPDAAGFRKAWEAALDLGIAQLEDVAMDRALNGYEVPVFHAGEEVGTRRAYNDRLLMFLLRNRSPERFGGGVNGANNGARLKGLNAVGKMEKRRLKKKWHKKWEKEHAAKAGVTAKQIHASIDRKIERVRAQVEAERAQAWEQVSEETRTAWKRFEELRDRDFERLGLDEELRRGLREGPRGASDGAAEAQDDGLD